MRPRVVSAYALVLAAFAVFASVYFYVHIQDLREQRVTDQARTFRTICDRQEVVTRRLIDAKLKVAVNASIMRELIVGVTLPANGQAPTTRRALIRAARRLDGEIRELRVNVRELERELRAVNCAHLSSNGGFRD